MGRNRIVKICDKIIEFGIIFLIIFTPLAFGTVHVWSYTLMELTVIILILGWLLKLIVTGYNSKLATGYWPALP